MPIYTCTTTESTLSAQAKKALAGEIGTIHSEVNHVPSTYVNVVFNELPADDVYTDGVPASPVLVSGWIREGHPKKEVTRLATEITGAVTRVTGVPTKRVLVVFQSSPASSLSKAGASCPSQGRKRPGSLAAEGSERRSENLCSRLPFRSGATVSEVTVSACGEVSARMGF